MARLDCPGILVERARLIITEEAEFFLAERVVVEGKLVELAIELKPDRVVKRRRHARQVQQPERQVLAQIRRIHVFGQQRRVGDSSPRPRMAQLVFVVEIQAVGFLRVLRRGIAAEIDVDVVIEFSIVIKRSARTGLRIRGTLICRAPAIRPRWEPPSSRCTCCGPRRCCPAGRLSLGWKLSPRGAVDGARADDSTPSFAEMAVPGATFEGDWNEKTFFLQPEVRRSIRWPESMSRARVFEAANVYAAGLLTLQRQYASWAGMGLLDKNLDELEQRLAAAREKGACLLSLGWGGGLPTKSAWLDATNTDYRQILQEFGQYNSALAGNLPFPKTRRIVFLNNRPATLPGWVELTVEG